MKYVITTNKPLEQCSDDPTEVTDMLQMGHVIAMHNDDGFLVANVRSIEEKTSELTARDLEIKEMLTDHSKQPKLRGIGADNCTVLAADALLFLERELGIDGVFLQSIVEGSDSSELYEILTHS